MLTEKNRLLSGDSIDSASLDSWDKGYTRLTPCLPTRAIHITDSARELCMLTSLRKNYSNVQRNV